MVAAGEHEGTQEVTLGHSVTASQRETMERSELSLRSCTSGQRAGDGPGLTAVHGAGHTAEGWLGGKRMSPGCDCSISSNDKDREDQKQQEAKGLYTG